MNILDKLKKLPIDLGQVNLRKKTKGKLIALSLICKVVDINKRFPFKNDCFDFVSPTT